MLADTDAGSLVTAAQSGATWGYRLVLPEILLIPVLYVVQEMTVRLGIVTGHGHGALIRARFGRWWAMLSAGTLFASAMGALLTEFAAVAGVGRIFGLPPWQTVPVAAVFLLAITLTGSYQRVERIAIAVGLAELAFVAASLMSRPRPAAVATGMISMPMDSASYLMLLAANVGAVIMPWMIFYQQRAVIDKRLTTTEIRTARRDTALGAALTQVIMISVVVVVAATVGAHHRGASLSSVGQIASALTPSLGRAAGTLLFALGMLGAALVAAIVSSLAGAWGLAEVFGWPHSLNDRPSRRNAPFYLTYSAAHLAAAGLVLASVDLVRLSVDVEIMNALLLPVVLGFLLALEATALPREWRMRGVRRVVTWGLCLVVIGFGLSLLPGVLCAG
jgi:Mn2+/Fe2+ NRAMP family transporter